MPQCKVFSPQVVSAPLRMCTLTGDLAPKRAPDRILRACTQVKSAINGSVKMLMCIAVNEMKQKGMVKAPLVI